jgi:hypothetical protein
MQNKLWYNQAVPYKAEKKSVQIAVKLPESVFQLIEQVCSKEDRPVGYVARELMLRGLTLYRNDGLLRDQPLPEISPRAQKEIQRLHKVNGNIEPVPDERVAYVRNLGELTDETAKPKQKTVKKRAGGRR